MKNNKPTQLIRRPTFSVEKLKIFGAPISEAAEESIKESRPKVRDIMADFKWHTLKELE